MHLSQWIVPVLCLTASCSDGSGAASGGLPVTSGGATAMTSGASMTGGTGTTSLGGAASGGTAAVVMAGGGSSGNTGSSLAGAAGQVTVSMAGGPSGAGAGGTLTVQGGAGAFAGGASAGTTASGGLGGEGQGGEGLGGTGVGGTSMAGGAGGAASDLLSHAAGFHELFIHDACTGVEESQPDTCLHEQLVEESFTFGGTGTDTYAVTLRVRGLFEPTTISGGEAPLSEHPYYRVGGTVTAVDYSQWHIEVSDPPETYWLNHYPSTSHTIYQEDFEATIEVAAGANVMVRVIDGNNRQIDNAEEGLEDRRQLIEGVTDEVLDGQMLRLDVIDVVPQE